MTTKNKNWKELLFEKKYPNWVLLLVVLIPAVLFYIWVQGLVAKFQ